MVCELDMLWELGNASNFFDAQLFCFDTQLGLGSYWCQIVSKMI